MDQQTKKLLILIAKTETKVKLAKKREETHKRYFSQLANQHQYFLIATLIPAFLAGWHSGKRAKSGQLLRQFSKFSFFTLLNIVRSYNKLI